jgi:mRNA interferase RelE/StbE
MADRTRIRAPDHIVELVRRLHPELKRKVRAAIDAIVAAPEIGKALRDELEGLRSLRVGRMRIIYRTISSQIDLVAVGPRATIYEETARIMARDRVPAVEQRPASRRPRRRDK